MIYLIAGMGLVIVLLGGYADIQHNRVIAAKAELGECTAKIEQQNQAIAATKAEGDRRVAEASKGVKAATVATAKARSEADRLRGLAGGATPTGTCSSASAVAEIRKGLAP